MKVAIMGAGLSGLACALTLEKHGITPTIYENRSQVGDRFVNAEVLLSILVRPIDDCISYLSEKYGIYLKPTSHLQTMTIHSERQKAVIQSQLGFANIRGREYDSYEKQLSRQVKTRIHYKSKKTYEQLLQEYTHVVLATGDGNYSKQLKNFREDLTVHIEGRTVEGEFDRQEVKTWLNNELAPKGYGFMIPFSEKEASIAVAYPDTDLKDEEAGRIHKLQWDKFYQQVSLDIGTPLRITDQFQISKYSIGTCEKGRIGNTFFVGNCFGSIMPFLGFGQFAALLTGIYAADDLCGNGNYEEATEELRRSYGHSLMLRRAMESQSNERFDKIVRLLSTRWGQKMFELKNVNILKGASTLLSPWIKIKSKGESK